jgi:hypothetical protein
MMAAVWLLVLLNHSLHLRFSLTHSSTHRHRGLSNNRESSSIFLAQSRELTKRGLRGTAARARLRSSDLPLRPATREDHSPTVGCSDVYSLSRNACRCCDHRHRPPPTRKHVGVVIIVTPTRLHACISLLICDHYHQHTTRTHVVGARVSPQCTPTRERAHPLPVSRVTTF